MYKKLLEELFIKMDNYKINYLVLRGYEDLPEVVHHDLDFAIRENSLKPFFLLLEDMSKTYDYSIKKDTVRQGLLKVYLEFEGSSLQIDIFCEFRYAGLEYIDIDDLFVNQRKLSTQINVPKNNYELAVSFLKEILHNSRIRKDKVLSIRKLYIETDFAIPFAKFFSNKTISNFSIALFTDNQFEFKNISSKARIDLLQMNFKKYGYFKTIQNIFIFFWIKYFNLNFYNKYIFPTN